MVLRCQMLKISVQSMPAALRNSCSRSLDHIHGAQTVRQRSSLDTVAVSDSEDLHAPSHTHPTVEGDNSLRNAATYAIDPMLVQD